MPQIKPGTLRYRTKEQLAQDLEFILTAPVKYGTQFAALKDAMWFGLITTGNTRLGKAASAFRR